MIESGPAGMHITYQALRDGVEVVMYEKSDRPGGLLAVGIPHRKFDKSYLDFDFKRLQEMGLQMHLNSEVVCEDGTPPYVIVGEERRELSTEKVVLCTGAGKPRNQS